MAQIDRFTGRRIDEIDDTEACESDLSAPWGEIGPHRSLKDTSPAYEGSNSGAAPLPPTTALFTRLVRRSGKRTVARESASRKWTRSASGDAREAGARKLARVTRRRSTLEIDARDVRG